MVAFNQLDPFITDWNTLASSGASPKFTPVHALDPWIGKSDGNSDSRLIEYIRRNLVSNCSHDGVNRREMLAAVSGDLSQMAFKSDLRGLWNSSSGAGAMSDEWVDNWWNFLVNEWQDASTGTWGARYNTGQKSASGEEVVVQGHDLSITFHILSYSHKDHRHAPRLYPELFDWLLSPTFHVDVYPYGRLYRGRPCAHNDYDVARLWEFVLPAVPVPDTTSRNAAADWLVNVTQDTLTQQLGADYVFEARMGSLQEAQYFGVALLNRVGYFNSSKRWWADSYGKGKAAADALWPQAAQTCCGICQAVEKLGFNGGVSDSTWALLRDGCPGCVPVNART